MNFLGNLYTLIEIAINHNADKEELRTISYYMNKKNIDKIYELSYLKKFIPYCDWYIVNDKNVLAMPAHIYDLYRDTGMLPDINNYDYNPDVDKLEHWQYINPFMFEINPNNGFEFAEKHFKDCDIWNLFLSGSARIDYYQGSKTDLETRIKYAIVEYMLRRPQFYTTEDFVENEILIKKYKKKEEQ